MLTFNPRATIPFALSLPADYRGGLLFLVPIPPGVMGTTSSVFIYKPEELLILAPASILEGFGRQE